MTTMVFLLYPNGKQVRLTNGHSITAVGAEWFIHDKKKNLVTRFPVSCGVIPLYPEGFSLSQQPIPLGKVVHDLAYRLEEECNGWSRKPILKKLKRLIENYDLRTGALKGGE